MQCFLKNRNRVSCDLLNGMGCAFDQVIAEAMGSSKRSVKNTVRLCSTARERFC